MKINIHAPWEVNDYHKNLIHERVEKFEQYFKKITHTDVYLKMKDKQPPNDKIVEILVRVPGPDIFAEAAEDSFEKAIAQAADKVKKQLIKRKEKLQSH